MRIPSDKTESLHFTETIGLGALSVSEKYLEIMKLADGAGLFQPQSLSIMHDIFEKTYIKENINNNDLIELYHQVDKGINREH